MDSFLDLCSDLVVTDLNLEFLKVSEWKVEVEFVVKVLEDVEVLEDIEAVKLVSEVVKVFEMET